MVQVLLVALFVGMGAVDLELGYFWHLTKGQLRLLWRAKPIVRVLKDPNLDAHIRKRLLLAEDIRAFAKDEIGLSTSRNYTTFVDIGKGPVSWNLVVCAKDQLAPRSWTYPIVGSMPYRGYFDREEAEEARDSFRRQGFDTYLRPVSAYSTLGWFPDPILSTMLRYSEADLADLLIHELTHATLWIESDVTFNESLASFVGEMGALIWLQKKYGPDAPVVKEVQDLRSDALVFRQFMYGIATKLDSVYASHTDVETKLEEKTRIFDEAKQAYYDLPLKTDRYDYFPQWELNNARVALYRVYQARTDIFERVFEAVGHNLNRAISVFKSCETAPKPDACLSTWLKKHEG